MLPNLQEAHRLLDEAEKCNPGPWKQHSLITAYCAYQMASYCHLDQKKAYILGLLHDIGRKEGVTYLRHTIDGY